jgi:cobalamin biosynthesis protein CobD/CbiB
MLGGDKQAGSCLLAVVDLERLRWLVQVTIVVVRGSAAEQLVKDWSEAGQDRGLALLLEQLSGIVGRDLTSLS